MVGAAKWRNTLASTDELKIEQQMLQSVVLISLDGPVSVTTYEKLEAILDDLFFQGHYRLVVDMARVKYVSSAGAGVLMNALSQCRENNGNVVLANVTPAVAEILDLLNLTNVLPAAHSLDEALKGF